jgi:hypothetical protein
MASRINADSSNGLQLISDSSGEVQIQSSGVTICTINSSGLSMQSGSAPIPDALSTASGSAPSYSARVWVNFNGTGTIAVRNSGNVSSLTDNGTGDYTVSFTTALSASTYCVTAHTNHVTNTSNTRGFLQSKTTNRTTTTIRVVCVGDGGTILDFEVIDFALFI